MLFRWVQEGGVKFKWAESSPAHGVFADLERSQLRVKLGSHVDLTEARVSPLKKSGRSCGYPPGKWKINRATKWSFIYEKGVSPDFHTDVWKWKWVKGLVSSLTNGGMSKVLKTSSKENVKSRHICVCQLGGRICVTDTKSAYDTGTSWYQFHPHRTKLEFLWIRIIYMNTSFLKLTEL